MAVDIAVSERFQIVPATGYLEDFRATKDAIDVVRVAEVGDETEIALRVLTAPIDWQFQEDARVRLRVVCSDNA